MGMLSVARLFHLPGDAVTSDVYVNFPDFKHCMSDEAGLLGNSGPGPANLLCIRHLLALLYCITTVSEGPRRKGNHRIRQRWNSEMIREAELQGRWVIVYFRDSTEVKEMRIRKSHLIRANYFVQHYIHRLCVLKKHEMPNNTRNTQTLSKAK